MWKIIRIFVSVFVAFETLFTGIAGGIMPKSIDMPEVTTGEYTQYVDPFIGGPANSDAEVYRRGCKLPIEQAGL